MRIHMLWVLSLCLSGCGSSDPYAGMDFSSLGTVFSEAQQTSFWVSRCGFQPGAQRVDIIRYFEADESTLFPYLTHEDKISWLGPFQLKTVGTDPAFPYGEGSVRVVGSFATPIVEEEVIQYSLDEELAYKVNKSASYTNHCGVMRTMPFNTGVVLHWTLRFDAKSGSPTWLQNYTESYLEGRLDVLRDRVEAEKFRTPRP